MWKLSYHFMFQESQPSLFYYHICWMESLELVVTTEVEDWSQNFGHSHMGQVQGFSATKPKQHQDKFCITC